MCCLDVQWSNRPKQVLESFVLLLSPLAPHLAEELWSRLGHTESLAYEPWPEVLSSEYIFLTNPSNSFPACVANICLMRGIGV